MTLWAALGVVLLLAALGSKIGGAISRILLVILVKGGLLSNIRVGDAAKVTITVHAIKFSFWKCAWTFLRAPTQTHLLCIEVPEVHVLVMLDTSQAAAPTAQNKPQDDAFAHLAALLDRDVSLKNLQHAIWSPIRAWIHRLNFVCYFVHLVTLSVASISVDVVDAEAEQRAIVSAKHGSVFVYANYNSKFDEMLCAVKVSHESTLQCAVPSVEGMLEVGPLEVRVCIPVSRNVGDHRAPVPASCFVSCDFVSAQADFLRCVRLLCSQQEHTCMAAECPSAAMSPEEVRTAHLVILRLIEAIPDEIGFILHRVELKLLSSKPQSGVKSNEVACSLSKLSVRVIDSRRNRLLGICTKADDASLGDERKLSLELGGLCLGVQSEFQELPPLLKLDMLKCDLEVKLAGFSEVESTGAETMFDSEFTATLSCSSRISGESKGLSVAVHADLQPWIACIQSELERATIASVRAPFQECWCVATADNPVFDAVAMEMEVQFKVLQTEVCFRSLDKQCAVLPAGAPSVLLTVEEINIFSHPFVGEQTLGVRSKADIQCSRLKILYCTRDKLLKTCFISLDFTRVFVEPVSLMNASQSPAEVEMEAEWLEVKWTPDALHSIGGMLELGVFVASPFMKELPSDPATRFGDDWDANAKTRIPPLKTLEDVSADKLSGSETVKFRCTVKRTLVLFAYTFESHSHIDYVTVDALSMSVEETTGRFRISVSQTKVYHVEPNKEAAFANPSFANQRPPRRTSSNFYARRPQAAQVASPAGKRTRCSPGFQSCGTDNMKAGLPYFTVQSFALEESKILRCPKTVVDIYVDNVQCDWDISTQVRVMELVRRITFSTWEMLYAVRRGYALCCTATDSRYNRDGGVNPPMDDSDECERYVSLLGKLISATGDTLNRLHATNITMNARISGETQLQLRIGLFGGDDMPDLWTFGDIAFELNSLSMLSIKSVRVRHTVGKRDDYVFGEFEEALRLRMAACGDARSSESSRSDGMLIDIEGVRVRLSTEISFLRHVSTIQEAVSPFLEPLATTMAAFWRPQDDEFYQYFLRVPLTPGRLQVWLSVENLALECLDVRLESWLERMYPLWLEELQEQELRAQVLEEQVATLKLTNADMLCGDAYEEMKALLVEKNSKIYFQKVKKLQSKYQQSREAEADSCGALFCVRIGHLSTDMSFESDRRKTVKLMHELDEATESVGTVFARYGREYSRFSPSFGLLEGIKMDVKIGDLSVRMRNFATPLLVCSQLRLSGDIIAVAARAATATSGTETSLFFAGLRSFVNLAVELENPIAFFGPSYLYTLDEIAGLAQGLLPLLLFDIDKQCGTPPWDIARRLFHGRVSVSIRNAAVRLLCCSTSFDVSDYLEIALQHLMLDYSYGKTSVNLHRLTAKIEPGALSNIAEFSNISAELWTKWLSEGGNSAVHFGFPIEYVAEESGESKDSRVILDSWASRLLKPDQLQPRSGLADNPLKRYQATGLSVFVRGKMSSGNASVGSPASSDARSKHDIATRTAIVLYTKHIEWLIRFASLYLKLPRTPFPRRRRNRLSLVSPTLTLRSATPSFLSICKGISVEEFTIVGLDLALYHSEKHPVGIRAFINEQIAISGAILASTHELFQAVQAPAKKQIKARRLRVPFSDQVWIVHDVTVAVQDIQVRICTPQSGSRGESLVSVKHMALKVGGGSETTPTHDDSAAMSPGPSGSVADERAESFSPSSNATETRVRTKKNILEHFSIAQHNPYCFRDTDHDPNAETGEPGELEQHGERSYQATFVEEFRRLGFLMGLSAREARILVTLGAVEALVDIVENWMRIITVCVPELLGESDDSGPGEEKLASIVTNEDSSPKKITSLTEDPKFGAIFYESVVRDTSGSFARRFSPPSFLSDDATDKTDSSASDGSSSASTNGGHTQTTPSGANIVESFFMVKFMDCQISVQDHLHKGSVLLALNCGSLKDSVSSDSCHELIDLKVDGLQLFTAPLDIDVKSRIIWLKTLPDGSYCPSSYGLLKQVIAPIPTKVVIWVDRNATILNKIDLQIPTIQVGLNVMSKDILQNLAEALTTLITAKVASKKTPDYSRMLQATRVVGSSDAHSIHHLRVLKKQLKWKIADIQWHQSCRWSYYVSERANVAFAAAENSRSLAFEMETSPLFRRRKISSTSMSSLTTTMSMSGSGNTHGDIEQHSDDLQRFTQQYESVSEMLHSMVRSEQKKLEPLPNVEMDFHLQSASLTLSCANMDIVRASMSSLRFKMKQFEDQSGSFTLTLQDLSTQNLCPGTPYPDLLQPSSTSNTWGGGNVFLRVDAEIAAPVGGITIVKHFEVNVHPLQVCITQEVILHLVAFFTSTAASSSTQEEKRDEVRSKFLQARPTGSSSDGLVGSALKKAVKVAGKAAHPLGLGKAHKDESDSAAATRRTKSFTTIQEEASMWMSKATGNQANETQLLLRSDDDLARGSDQQAQQDAAEREVSEMKDRAKTNILFKRIRIGTVEVVVTYKNKKSHHHNHQPLEDMRGFEVKVHALVYCDKTCSMMDLLLRIRRDVILDVLSQVGRNFTNIANFLRDQVDITRWGQFDALAPLKSLSTTVTSLASNATQSSSVVPASSIPTPKPMEMSPRARAATAPSSSQDTAQKFQLELPESHRSLRKKHTIPSVRPAEAVHRGLPMPSSATNVSPAPSPRREGDLEHACDAEGDPSHRHRRSTAGKAKNAIAHLFSKKRSGNSSIPSSPSKPDERLGASPIPPATAVRLDDDASNRSHHPPSSSSRARGE